VQGSGLIDPGRRIRHRLTSLCAQTVPCTARRIALRGPGDLRAVLSPQPGVLPDGLAALVPRRRRLAPRPRGLSRGWGERPMAVMSYVCSPRSLSPVPCRSRRPAVGPHRLRLRPRARRRRRDGSGTGGSGCGWRWRSA
jgi:hypothetical protein